MPETSKPRLHLSPFTTAGADFVITEPMVVARSSKALIVVHPLRISFVHIVVLPLQRFQAPDEIQQFYALALEIAQSFINRHSTKANVQRFLEKFAHVGAYELPEDAKPLIRPEIAQNRPESPDFQVADFMSTFASTEKVPFARGVFLTATEFSTCQMHIISEDFRYIGKNGRLLWNIFHSKYFLRIREDSVDKLENMLIPTKVTLDELTPFLSVMPTKCGKCGISVEGLEALRNHYLVSHTGELIAEENAQETSQRPKRDSPAIAKAKGFLAKKKAARRTDLPETPKQTTCDNNINAVTSLLVKWSTYYFNLHFLKDSRANSDDAPSDFMEIEEAVRSASRVLEKLQEMECVSQEHRRRFLHMQRKIRNSIYGVEEKVLKIA